MAVVQTSELEATLSKYKARPSDDIKQYGNGYATTCKAIVTLGSRVRSLLEAWMYVRVFLCCVVLCCVVLCR